MNSSSASGTSLARGILLLAAALGACSLEFKGEATEYRLSAATQDILRDDAAAQAELNAQLQRLFGTRSAPHFAPPAEVFNARAAIAQLVTTGEAQQGTEPGAPSLAESAELYANKCLHCHGNEGGGDGVTALSLSPMPRDFRRGIYKYDNITEGARPELIDFVRIITRGIEGTAMPSLKMQTEAQIHGLAEYARLLAMRGETEAWLAAEYEPGVGFSDALANETYADIVELWLEQERVRVDAPGDAPQVNTQTITRGFELFHDGQGAACATCHGNGGRGGGSAAWGVTPENPDEDVPLLRDSWGHEAEPRDLVSSTFTQGDDAASLFERIYLGIDGTPMAGIGGTRRTDGTPLFDTNDLWSLVHYVRALRDPQWQELTEELGRAAQQRQ